MSQRRKAIGEAVRTVVETLEDRRLLTTVGPISTSFTGADQHLTIPFSDAVAGGSAYTVNVHNLSTGNPLAVSRTAISTDGKTATFQPNTTPMPNGWYELYVNGGTLTSEETRTDFTFLNADFDQSGTTDFNDYLVLQNNFGVTSGATFIQGDANYDHAVDFNDYLVLQNNFGQTLPDLPTQVGGVVVGNAVANALDVGWAYDAATPRDGFKIYRSTNGVDFTLVKTLTNATVTAWRDDGSETPTDPLVVGQKYWYRVRSYTNAAGASAAVTKASAIVTNPTAAPTDLKAAGIGPGRVSLMWTPPANTTVISYRVYRSKNPNFLTSAGTLVTVTDSKTTKIVDSGISRGHTYYYRVVAVGTHGSVSLPSLAVSAVAQNNLSGISNASNNHVPFDPTTHDSDGDNTPDAVDTDNDNDDIDDEQDDDDDNNGVPDNAEPDDRDSDGDGINDTNDDNDDDDQNPDSIDTDDNGNGIIDDEDPASGKVDLVPYGAGRHTVFSNLRGSHVFGVGDTRNGLTPDYVGFEFGTPDVIEDYETGETIEVDEPKMYGFANDGQTFTLRNVPKHAYVEYGFNLMGAQTGEVSVKVEGHEIKQHLNVADTAFNGRVASQSDTINISLTGTGFNPEADENWEIYNFWMNVVMPSISIYADKGSIPEAGSGPDPETGITPDDPTAITYTVVRNFDFGTTPVKLDWGLGTAGSEDFTGDEDTVTFADGEMYKEVVVHVADDNKAEWTESIVAQVQPPDSDDYYVNVIDLPTAQSDVLDDDASIIIGEESLLVNNNDSDNDGVVDLYDTDGVGMDAELYPVTLEYPAGSDGTVKLTKSGGIRLWKNSDRTGEITDQTILDPGDGSIETVYAEATSASSAMDEIHIGLKAIDNPSNAGGGYDSGTSTQPAVKPLVTTTQPVQDATTQANQVDVIVTGPNGRTEVLVGEQISAHLAATGPDTNGWSGSWTSVPEGALFDDFIATNTSGHKVAFDPAKKQMTDFNSYFFDGTMGGQSQTFSGSVAFNGKSVSRTIKLKVFKPTVDVILDKVGVVRAVPAGLGLFGAAQGEQGIMHSVQVKVPAGFAEGTYHYTQLINYTYSYRKPPLAHPAVVLPTEFGSHNGMAGLDTATPYPAGGGPFSTGTPAQGVPNPVQVDNPRFLIPGAPAYGGDQYNYYERNEEFTTYVMFTPSSGKSVPLTKGVWGWKGKFNYVGGLPPWTTDVGGTTQWNNGLQETNEFPDWSTVISGATFQWIPQPA